MRLLLLSALALVVVTSTATSARGQTTPERPARPYRGLFGGNQQEEGERTTQQLNVTFLAEGSYDDNVAAELTGGNPGQYQGSGYGASGLGVVEFKRGRTDRFLSISAQTGVRRLEDRKGASSDVNYVHHAATFSGRTKLGRSTTFSADQRVGYQPYYSLRGLPVYSAPDSGLPPVAGVDYALDSSRSLQYGTRVGLNRALGRRSNLGVAYDFNYTDFRRETERLRDSSNQSAHATFSSGLGRQSDWFGAYTYQRGTYGFGSLEGNKVFEGHEGQLGIKLERRLSPTRRLLLSASAGPSVTDSPGLDAGRVRHTGAAATGGVGIDLARSWGLRGDYRRGVKFIEGFNQPFASQRATLALSGYVTRSWSLVANGGYDTGEVSFTGTRNFSTGLAQLQSQHALTRHLAVTATYFFYRYNYDETVSLPSGLPRELDRQGVRVSLVLWIPVL